MKTGQKLCVQGLGCKVKANCPHMGHGRIGELPPCGTVFKDTQKNFTTLRLMVEEIFR